MAEGDGNDGQQGDGQGGESHDIRRLREQAAKAVELEDRLAQFERREAFREAGIDLNTGPGRLLFKSHDGELTPEAIKAAAEEYGVLPKAPAEGEGGNASGEGQSSTEEPTGSRDRDELAAGAGADEGHKPNPYTVAQQAAKEAMEQGASQENASALFLQTLAKAAMEGDQRVLVKDR